MVARGVSSCGWCGYSTNILRELRRLGGRTACAIMPALVPLLLCLLYGCGGAPRVAAEEREVVPAAQDIRADGRVIRVNNTTGEVYINLTRKDRVLPGVPFTCFDPRTGITLNTDQAAQGNGGIEVIAVGDDFSICRITRTSNNRAIQPGDLVYNTVFHNSRNRPQHFIVAGDFDLDGDGIRTAAEGERLIMLIRAWGAVVDDAISIHTDYLVLGQRPLGPSIQEPPPDNSPGSIIDQRTLEQKHYDELLEFARKYRIPVLNLNRGLMLIGYYDRQWARQ
jgi:hypothetical protein